MDDYKSSCHHIFLYFLIKESKRNIFYNHYIRDIMRFQQPVECMISGSQWTTNSKQPQALGIKLNKPFGFKQNDVGLQKICIKDCINFVQFLIEKNQSASKSLKQFEDWRCKQIMSIGCFKEILINTYQYSLKPRDQRLKNLKFTEKSEQTIVGQLLSILLKNIKNAGQNLLIEQNYLTKYKQCCRTICNKLSMQKYKRDYVCSFCDNILSKFALCSKKFIQEKNIFKSVWEKENCNHKMTYPKLLQTVKQYIQSQKEYRNYLKKYFNEEFQLAQYVTQVVIILQEIVKSYEDCQIQEDYFISEKRLCQQLIQKAKKQFILRSICIKSERWKYFVDYLYPHCGGISAKYTLCQGFMEQIQLEQ